MTQSNVEQKITTLYKANYAHLSAVLLRLLGAKNIELVADITQDTFTKAITTWTKSGVPEHAEAWLMTTAKNLAYDSLRSHKVREKYKDSLSPELLSNWTIAGKLNQQFGNDLHASHLHDTPAEFGHFANNDEQIRMLVWLSTSPLKAAYLFPAMLKLVCGLPTEAVARALLITPSNAQKRLNRAMGQLKSHDFGSADAITTDTTTAQKADSSTKTLVKEKLHKALYLLFNEGLQSHLHTGNTINTMCIEAVNLMQAVKASPQISGEQSLALLALMHLHLARQPSRFVNSTDKAQTSATQNTVTQVPLNKQDRSLWKNEHLVAGMHILTLVLTPFKGAKSDHLIQANPYLYEALIANEHLRAKHFEDTNWTLISEFYQKWLNLEDSPLVRINLAIALAHNGEGHKALVELESVAKYKQFAATYHIPASRAYIFYLLGDKSQSDHCLQEAIAAGIHKSELALLKSQLGKE